MQLNRDFPSIDFTPPPKKKRKNLKLFYFWSFIANLCGRHLFFVLGRPFGRRGVLSDFEGVVVPRSSLGKTHITQLIVPRSPCFLVWYLEMD